MYLHEPELVGEAICLPFLCTRSQLPMLGNHHYLVKFSELHCISTAFYSLGSWKNAACNGQDSSTECPSQQVAWTYLDESCSL